jgi:hypothetical protein
LTFFGDDGAFSGENGNCLAPGGGVLSGGVLGGGGGVNSTGPSGAITVSFFS